MTYQHFNSYLKQQWQLKVFVGNSQHSSVAPTIATLRFLYPPVKSFIMMLPIEHFPIPNSSNYHFAVGLQCRLSVTNHPQAIAYQGEECKIVAVRIMRSSEPMLIVQFPDGAQIKGLFFYELEDLEGNQLLRDTFNRLSSAKKINKESSIYQLF